MSNSLDPVQDQHFVGPDRGPNCLQRLSADDKQGNCFLFVTTAPKPRGTVGSSSNSLL